MCIRDRYYSDYRSMVCIKAVANKKDEEYIVTALSQRKDIKLFEVEPGKEDHLLNIKIYTVINQRDIYAVSYTHLDVYKRQGNSFMIVNPFGFRVLQMIESGLDFNTLISQLCCGNEKIELKLKKDIVSFLLE